MQRKDRRSTVDDSEEVQLLREIRDLLRPIAHHHRGEYEEWQAEELSKLLVEVKAVVDASPTRRKAWTLADGSRTKQQISKQSSLDQGSTSRFFKRLGALGAVEGELPKRTMEV